MNPRVSGACRSVGAGRLLAILIAALPLVSSCADRGTTRPPNPDPYQWTDAQIRNFVYSPYRDPDGFYHEDLAGGAVYYENTVSIAPAEEREYRWIELCTEDQAQALAWSESSAVHSAYYRDLVSERETEKYFEFRRARPAYPSDILLSRVHKCGYLDRSMVDRFVPAPVLGRFRHRPITGEATKELIEYMWFTNLTGGGRVLASATTETAEAFHQTILYTDLVIGDWGLCDRIALTRAIFHVEKETGVITRDLDTLRVITGRCR